MSDSPHQAIPQTGTDAQIKLTETAEPQVQGQQDAQPGNLTPNTHAGRLISGLVGRPIVPGEDVNNLWAEMQQAVGKKWAVTVAPGPKGGKPSVQQVSLPPE